MHTSVLVFIIASFAAGAVPPPAELSGVTTVPGPHIYYKKHPQSGCAGQKHDFSAVSIDIDKDACMEACDKRNDCASFASKMEPSSQCLLSTSCTPGEPNWEIREQDWEGWTTFVKM